MITQFGRVRCYAALVAGITLMLMGCGGGGGNPASPPPMTQAPSGLSYPDVGTPVVGVAVPALTPTVMGAVSGYSVTPPLPAGLTLDPTSGTLSGTPTAAIPNASYVVKATNSGGSATATLQFAVGSVDVVSESSITRTVVAGTAVYVDVVIQPRYLQFAGTLFSMASDPNNVFAKPVSVTNNNDGTFTLEFATSPAAPSAEYSGAATLKLCSDSECNNVGSLLWSWVPPASGDVGFKSDVLLTKNLVFVSTNLSTYAVDLTTHKAVWSYPVTGNLALSSNGVLYLEGINTLTAINAK